MNTTINHGQFLKQEYANIEIPNNLDAVVLEGLKKGRQAAVKSQVKHMTTVAAAVLLLLVSSLTVSINVSPAFAESLSKIPVLDRIVEILRFNDGKASGGQITDGTDIKDMTIVESGDTERFMIHFDQVSTLTDDVGAYEIHMYENPKVIQFDIGGSRMISAAKDFEAIRGLKHINDVYTLMTLDDSLIRFQVVLGENTNAEIAKITDPPGLLVTLVTDGQREGKQKDVYSVRTKSYPKSEGFGHMEEDLFWAQKDGFIPEYRIIKDQEGFFLYELGQFESQETAEVFRVKAQETLSFELLIEKRLNLDLPQKFE